MSSWALPPAPPDVLPYQQRARALPDRLLHLGGRLSRVGRHGGLGGHRQGRKVGDVGCHGGHGGHSQGRHWDCLACFGVAQNVGMLLSITQTFSSLKDENVLQFQIQVESTLNWWFMLCYSLLLFCMPQALELLSAVHGPVVKETFKTGVVKVGGCWCR